MNNLKKLERIKVFISSPNDVSEARDNVRYAINRINSLMAKDYGFLFEPVGSEDIPPGKEKRCQEHINKYVDMAHIYIGLLNQRFGSPTGIAESGTLEEYNRITNRWENEAEKPTVWFFFKSIPEERLGEKDEQLSKVLNFKETISKTDFYHEFDENKEIIEKIENSLSEWLRENKNSHINQNSVEFGLQLNDSDIENVFNIITNKALLAPQNTTNKLSKLGLIINENDQIVLKNSIGAFLRFVKIFINTKHYGNFIKTDYFQSTLKINISSIIKNRQRCDITQEQEKVLSMLLITSHSALYYIFYGDTTIFDNTFVHAHQINKVDLANRLNWESILASVMSFYINDLMNNTLNYEVYNKEIIGQIISMNIVSTFEDEKAFEAAVKMPIVRIPAKGPMQKGSLITVEPAFRLKLGMLFFKMGDYELAINKYDEIINTYSDKDIISAAYNNKGIVLLNMNNKEAANICFHEALKINPGLQEVKDNIRLIDSQKPNNN